MHDRRAAVVGDLVRAHRVEDRLRLDLAQADVDAGVGGHRPREAPAVAVEHRQRPQVHRVPRHAPVDDVRQRVEIGAAVMVDDALRIAGGAGRVVERDRVPLVRRVLPRVLGIAVGDERLVVDGAEALAARALRVDDVDDERLLREQRQRLLDRRRELGVGDEHLGLAVLQHERDRLGVEPRVERIEHAAGHRHAEMRLDHLRRVGGHQRDRVADADAGLGERRGEPAAARIGLGPGVAALAVDHGEMSRVRVGRARDQRQRRQRRVVGEVAVEVAVVRMRAGHVESGAVSELGRAGASGRLNDTAVAANGDARLGSPCFK